MPRLLWVGPFIDQWRVTDDADDSPQPEGIFDGRDKALDWACLQASRHAPCMVRMVDDAGSITAQFAFDPPSLMEAA